MSAYSTKDITRTEAEAMVRALRALKDDPVSKLSIDDLDAELHDYVYSEKYTEIVGVLTNYNIIPPTN